MCGLAGAVGGTEATVGVMLDRIVHRGPDGRGVARAGRAVHGHVRLALIDPTAASAQPFAYRGATLSFNGEIWNWRALRAELADLGHALTTRGDTEVLAAALDQWGVEGALPRLEGMFAFAWSRGDRHVLARDRYGKVPVYLLRRAAGLEWASERKAWLRGAAGAAAPLPLGTWLDLDEGAPRRWYEVPEEAERVNLAEALEDAVAQRLSADVPVCCLISGGLDSTLILSLAVRRRPDVVAYVATYDPDADDARSARRVCEELRVELREVRVPLPDEARVRAAVEAIEITSKAQVEIALLCLPLAARLAADGFKACLSGEGADELFGGYGNMQIKARGMGDRAWRGLRLAQLEKMGRGNFVRCNKAFMASGVEARLPFLDRRVVERALAAGVRECPPGKGMLKAAARGIAPDWVIRRQKDTFQGGSGVADACARLLAAPTRYYNAEARALFGAVTTA